VPLWHPAPSEKRKERRLYGVRLRQKKEKKKERCLYGILLIPPAHFRRV
jgi:hypothetical protein